MRVHAGIAAGQSASVTHWVQLPFEQMDATASPAVLAAGQSACVVQVWLLPVGPGGGEAHWLDPHQQVVLMHMLGGIGEMYEVGVASNGEMHDQTW
jgi:hypothetical protein